MTAREAGRAALARWLVAHTSRLLRPLAASVLARIAGQLLDVTLLVIAATAIARVATGEHVAVAVLIGWLVGLALVKALVELHGGWVALQSEPGQGATFTCHLPEEASAGAAAPELQFG